MIRNRQTAYSDPHRSVYGPQYDPAVNGVFRSINSAEEFKRRPESLRTGAGQLRPNGMAVPYAPGIGVPLIRTQTPVEER